MFAPNQDKYMRREIVRRYLSQLGDDRLRTMCILWSRGCSDRSVKRRLKLSWAKLNEQKAVIAEGLIAAGIKLKD